MAIKLEDEYPNAVPGSADYPGGSFKNSTSGSGTDGTPLEKKWANDFLGFFAAVLAASGLIPSGVPDTATVSQYLQGLGVLFAAKTSTDAHIGSISPHEATSAATINRIALRDASGRTKFAAGVAAADAVIVGQFYALLAATRFKSAAFTWVANTVFTYAHGLGVVPFKVFLVGKCISAEYGYAVGEYVYDLTFLDQDRIGSVSVGAGDTNVHFASGDSILAIIERVSSSSANIVQITPAKWEFYLYAEK